MTFMPLANMPANKRLAFLIQDLARVLRNKFDHLASESGMTTAQWRVLATVARCQSAKLEAPNQASLAEILEVEPITLSRQIDRLAAAGLIERRPDPADRRAHLLHLTDKALPLVEGFRNLGTKTMKAALEGISDTELSAVIDVLERFRTNLTGKPHTSGAFAEPEQPEKETSAAP